MLTKKPFSLLIKPTSADCNLRCQYCFYLDRSSLYPESARHRMSGAVLEKMIAGYMATDQPQYAFSWQGGEPCLMGVDFFRQVTRLQQKYGRRGSIVANSLQTNATLIDDELAAHLAQFKFLVGVSLDGPREVHDHFRTTASGRGTHAAVLKGIECLKRHRVEFNILNLVTAANAKKGKEIYRYLTGLGCYYHQYIPCVEFDEKGEPLPFSVSGEEWGEFLCGIFDEWYQSDTRKVSVRLFDSVLNFMVNGVYNICHLGGHCSQYFVVEHNGDVYPCDFFVEAARKLGNIAANPWDELLQSSAYRVFGDQKSRWNSRCATCAYLNYCSGDCLKHRFYGSANPEQTSWLCQGWRQFYEHSLPRFEKLALALLQERGHMNSKIPNVKAGRNDPCFCGSGKQYKKCHGSNS
jgi:uncharacterized protein